MKAPLTAMASTRAVRGLTPRPAAASSSSRMAISRTPALVRVRAQATAVTARVTAAAR